MSTPTKLKRVVIKEELIALTGHHIAAIVLNQFLYWSERTQDTDKYIREEAERAQHEPMELTHGWVYKSADELLDEIMLSISSTTLRKYIRQLVSGGWLSERNNPAHKWDRTLQYRPNILKIQADLQALGYALEGYPLLSKLKKLTNASQESENGSQKTENRTFENLGAIPETTTETKKKSSVATAPPPPQDTQDAQETQPLKANGKPRTAQDDMFDLCAYVLYQVTPENQAGMSTKAKANCGRTAKRLLKMNATESLVREWFKWWKNVPTDWNWQGKKQIPLPSDLSDSWSAFMDYRERKQAETRQAEIQGQAPPNFMAQVEQIISQQVSA